MAGASRAAGSWRLRLRLQGGLFAGAFLIILGVFMFAPLVASHDPYAIDPALQLRPPSRDHLAGTDQFGRDQFSRIVYGTRVSLGVSGVATGGALLVGGPLGLTAGFYGGRLDMALGVVMDVLFAFPAILLALAIVAILGPGQGNVMLAIAVVYVPSFYRVSRAASLSTRNTLYVDAALAIGASSTRTLFRHILPNAAAPLIVQITLGLAFAILAEAALSFLGLGTPPPTPSWGTMLFEGRRAMGIALWLAVYPGLAISAAILYLNLLGDYLRDRLDPTLRNL